MERGHLIAVVLVAALALVGVRYYISSDSAPEPDEVASTTRSAPRLGGGATNGVHEPREREQSRRSALVDQLSEQRQQRRAAVADDDHGEDGSQGGAEVVGGSRPGSSQVGGSGSARSQASGDVVASAGAAPGGGPSARSGAASGSGGGDGRAQAAPQHQPEGGGDAAPGAEGARHDPVDAPVLLSLPLNGNLDAEQGAGPTKVDGVMVDGDTVEFSDDAQVTLPSGGHVNGQAGSIAFDIEPRWAGDEESNHSLLQIRDADTWANNLQIVKNLDSLRFVIVDSAGIQTDVSVNIGDWQADEAHRITATWGQATMTLYVDGQPVGQAPLANGPTFKGTTPIHVGSDFPGSQYRSADGRISNLTIYGRALSANEVH